MIMTRLSTNTGHALDTLQGLGIQFFDSKGTPALWLMSLRSCAMPPPT